MEIQSIQIVLFSFVTTSFVFAYLVFSIQMNATDNISSYNNNGEQLYVDNFHIHRVAAPELLIVDRVITPVWYIIGVIGNTISAKIWLSRKMRTSNSSAIYLGAIAIVDLLFIFIHFWMELLQAWGISTFNKPILCEVYNVLLYVPQYLAPLLILGFTFERFIAICFPFMMGKVCSVKKAFIMTCFLTLFSIILGLFQANFWFFDPPSGVCEIRRSQEKFYSVWTWVTEMLIFAAVPLVVLVFNILVIREIKKMNRFQTSIGIDQSRVSNQTSTITLLSVSFYLICTLLPATIVYAIQLSIPKGSEKTKPSDWMKDPTWSSYMIYYHIRRIVEEICMSNYACYVFIYYITSAYFRAEVQRLWCLRKLCGKKQSAEQNSSLSSKYCVVKGQNYEKTMPIDL